MLIALDYDGTVTEDPIAWIKVARTLREAGHSVFIVTMRYESECDDIDAVWHKVTDGLIATSRRAKRPFCENLGLYINVWIDDNARAVEEDARAIWGFSSAEG